MLTSRGENDIQVRVCVSRLTWGERSEAYLMDVQYSAHHQEELVFKTKEFRRVLYTTVCSGTKGVITGEERLTSNRMTSD